MTTIDQLKLSAFAKVDAGQKEHKVTASKGSFKQVLKSALKAPENLNEMFSEASRKYGVSEKLLKAVAKAESNFNPSATSKAGAAGVMQLMPSTARSLGVSDPYDARSNIMGGAKYLRENLDRYNGNVEFALAAYNAGPNNVQKYGGIPPFKETREYVAKIMNYMGEGESALSAPSYRRSEPISFMNAFSNSNGFSPQEVLSLPYGQIRLTEELGGDQTLDKSDYLYFIELMKMRMQMASAGIGGQSEENDLTSGSMFF
ncbi:lytic transglycosylase domain-containing protein [Lacrimispora sp.]|uniref:lytic transglycosylase domain-containing protein n=1 Tax=Lacrimispora sp. TaxID=2719234 RepID=UPI003460949C